MIRHIRAAPVRVGTGYLALQQAILGMLFLGERGLTGGTGFLFRATPFSVSRETSMGAEEWWRHRDVG